MLLSAVSVLIAAQSSSEIPEGLMNNPVYIYICMYVKLEFLPFRFTDNAVRVGYNSKPVGSA